MNILEISVAALVLAALIFFCVCWLAIGSYQRAHQQRLEKEAWERLTNDPDIWLGSLIRSPGTHWMDGHGTSSHGEK